LLEDCPQLCHVFDRRARAAVFVGVKDPGDRSANMSVYDPRYG
jgi:hypothetical protein